MAGSFKNALLRIIVIATVWSCAAPAGEHAVPDVRPETVALTAGEHGLELMLPFPGGESRTLTRAYARAEDVCFPREERTTSHCTYASGLWDDRYALDFAGDGCSSWRSPVLAAAEGRVTIPPDPTGSRTRSYGVAEVAIDHGNGCASHYAHLDERIVTDGQFVRQGETIGYEGDRGSVHGTACPQHPGSHLHFKVICDGAAVKPEPLSGFRDLDRYALRRFTHKALHHPVGTLLKAAGDPRIYQVCGSGTLCHVRDERVWRAHRFFQDSREEWASVVTVDPDEIACHDVGPEIVSEPRIVATTCGQTGTFVAYDDGRTRWRRRIAFDASQAGYRILLRSWGFRLDEVARDDAACSIPIDANRPTLALRDGTVIEQASDNDFYVVADDGTAYRLYRNLMPVLYGRGWPQVIQVPTGSVPSLVRKVSHDHPEFTVTDATTCPNGRTQLEPGSGDAVGGGSSEPTLESYDFPAATVTPADPQGPLPPEGDGAAGSGGAADAPAAPVTSCTPTEPASTQPESGQGNAAPATPPTATQTQSGEIPPGSIMCTREAGAYRIRIRGPVSPLLVGSAPANPVEIKYGADRYGWTDYGYAIGSGKDLATWNGEGEYSLSIPADAGRFNLYLRGADGSIGWFDLPDADSDGDAWNVQGDCHVVCGADSCDLSF